jgi:cytochrome c5
MSQEKDKVFFRNFSLVVGALAVLMVIFIIAARIVGIDEEAATERQSASVAERTAPMGEVSVAGEEEEPALEAGAEAAPADVAVSGDGDAGKQVYDGLCASCHGLGPSMAAMIPQTGDKDAWAPRIAQGIDTLYKHAIEGFTSPGGMMMMPPRGGGDLGDDEVKAAVDYIVSQSQ